MLIFSIPVFSNDLTEPDLNSKDAEIYTQIFTELLNYPLEKKEKFGGTMESTVKKYFQTYVVPKLEQTDEIDKVIDQIEYDAFNIDLINKYRTNKNVSETLEVYNTIFHLSKKYNQSLIKEVMIYLQSNWKMSIMETITSLLNNYGFRQQSISI